MKKTIFAFSGIIVALLALFQLSKYSYATGNVSIEVIIAIIALVFLGIGIYLNKKSLHKVTPTLSNINFKKIEELGISKREYEVLTEISKGLSNKEIGDKLFVSESTIKTHVSNLLVKLGAKIIIGLLITVFTSLGIAIADYIYTAVINPDFFTEYAEMMKAKDPNIEIPQFTSGQAAGFMFAIVFFIGLIITLISSLILQRK